MATKKPLLPLALLATLVMLLPIIFTLAFFQASGNNSNPQTQRVIKFQTQATVEQTPDAVRISTTASFLAQSNEAATSGLAKISSDIRKTLATLNIPKADIKSANLNLYPEYTYDPKGTSSITGYKAIQNFTILLKDPTLAGQVVDLLAQVTQTNLTIDQVQPIVLDTKKAAQKATAEAVAQATKQAKTYAKLLGVRLGKIISLEESSPQIYYPERYPVMGKADTSAEPTQIDLGKQEVTVVLQISWQIH